MMHNMCLFMDYVIVYVKDFVLFSQVPGFRSYIIEKFANECCLYSVLDKSFEFRDANTVSP